MHVFQEQGCGCLLGHRPEEVAQIDQRPVPELFCVGQDILQIRACGEIKSEQLPDEMGLHCRLYAVVRSRR